MQALEVETTALAVTAVDGGALAVEAAGAGPPIVLVHGWTLDRRAWHPQLRHFERDHRVIAYDRRGCGASSAPPDLSREIDDLAAVLDAEGIGRAFIVAMSQGCRVALGFALRFPQRVSALALAGSPSPFVAAADGDAVPIAKMAVLASAGRFADLHDVLRRLPFMQLGGRSETALLDAIIASYRGRDLTQPAGELVIAADALANLPVPTLALVGERDSAARMDAARELAARIPHGAFAIVEDAYHLCNLSHPARFNAALAEFLEAHDGR